MKVKALSFRQPWAELVLQGKKTLDLRTWRTNYRGTLAVYASSTIEKEFCQKNNIDPNQLTTGAVIGLVDLVDVVQLDETQYIARAREHLNIRHFQNPLFGWELANPHLLEKPQTAKGQRRFFEVEIPDREITISSHRFESQPKANIQPLTSSAATWDANHPFELRVLPETDPNNGQAGYRLALYQRRVMPPSAQTMFYRQTPSQMERVVELGGATLRAIADQLLEALRENGYKATDLNPNRREPFALLEEWGVRLGLLFLAVKPVSKMNRIDTISYGIRRMTNEELYYWYSKCTSRSLAERAQKALRLLLAEE